MTDAFDRLPKFDARDFEPPAWAKEMRDGLEQRGESSTSVHEQSEGSSSSEHEEWVDAIEDRTFFQVEPPTMDELREALSKGTALKLSGNASFKAKPPNLSAALNAYQKAEAILAICPGRRQPSSGVEEVSEEEAQAIEDGRDALEGEIRECLKACYGNQAACHVEMKEDKEAVTACTKALELDPDYAKALSRRASANERIGTWPSLTSAQEDYKKLLEHKEYTSAAKKALQTLPERIREQQEKEKDEMLGKLKELGNGLLGKFGLSTDMFKFDQQEGGGYNMRFER